MGHIGSPDARNRLGHEHLDQPEGLVLQRRREGRSPTKPIEATPGPPQAVVTSCPSETNKRKVMKVTSRTKEQQANRDGWWKKTRGYVGKHRGMAKLGLVIGGSFATPFIVAGLLAINQGTGRAAAAWLGSALLMFAIAVTMALWSSRRD